MTAIREHGITEVYDIRTGSCTSVYGVIGPFFGIAVNEVELINGKRLPNAVQLSMGASERETGTT